MLCGSTVPEFVQLVADGAGAVAGEHATTREFKRVLERLNTDGRGVKWTLANTPLLPPRSPPLLDASVKALSPSQATLTAAFTALASLISVPGKRSTRREASAPTEPPFRCP